MRNMNFGGGVARLGQATTVINPFFDLNGPFMAQAVQGVRGLVAYFPANFGMDREKRKHHGMHGTAKGFAHGPVGVLPR
jgi:hypothetical protein